MEDLQNGVNESVPAEQTETASEPEVNAEGNESEVEGNETPETTEQPEAEPEDRNAAFARVRREAEAKANRRMSALDAEVAERFKGFTNPITGQPITTAKEYFDALDAQNQVDTQRTLAEKGLDPKLIDNAVNNNPAIKAANLILQQERLKNVQTYLDEQVAEVGKIDPDIKTAQDIEKSERYSEVLRYVKENHLSIVDAYKLTYADKLNERKTAAVKQQAINNAKSQSHLKATDGGNNVSDGFVDIPANVLPQWKEWFPYKTMKELRESYNNTLHRE
jgi:predicted nucleic acid-binding protein